MGKLPSRLTACRCTIAIFLFLWGNIIVSVRPENRADGGYLRLTGDVDDSSFKLPIFVDQHFEENVWTDGKQKQILKPVNVITRVHDIKTSESRKLHRSIGDRKRGIQNREEKNHNPSIQRMMNIHTTRKPRFLCLHGGGSNAAKLQTYIDVWPEAVVGNMDLVFINAPFRVYKETDDDEHYEWFTADKINTEYDNFEESILYIEDRMIELGPFDGVLGFSEGAIVAGALPGMQKQGLCLTKVGEIEHVVIMSGAKFGGERIPLPKLAETAYFSPINIPSLHIFGETDFARVTAAELVEAYVDPLVIYHHGGHEVPKLDEDGLKIMFEFLKRINAI